MVPVVLTCSRAGTGRMCEAGQKWGLISGLVIKVDAGIAFPCYDRRRGVVISIL